MKGKLIVIYGINNLGKSTQAKKLVERLLTEGHRAEYIKYPLYDVAPAGPMINDYLRNENPLDLSSREAQMLYVIDRLQYQSILEQKLSQGIHIIAEDYIGTGLAWGAVYGVSDSFLRTLNSSLRTEDIAFLFQGERFLDAVEKTHRHESDARIMEKATQAHDRLGSELGWVPVQANQSIEDIHEEIYKLVKDLV